MMKSQGVHLGYKNADGVEVNVHVYVYLARLVKCVHLFVSVLVILQHAFTPIIHTSRCCRR